MIRIFYFFIFLLVITSCNQNGDISKKRDMEFEEVNKELSSLEQNSRDGSQNQVFENTDVKVYGIKVKNTFPHDPNAYTQGLVYYDGYLYESTGLVGQSSLRKVELKTGKIIKKNDVKGGLFAEGIEIYNDKIYQLTWTSGLCLVYNLKTFEKLMEYNYSGEGWGITAIDDKLVMSNGTGTLKFMDPKSFNVIGSLNVGDALSYLNELEYINGEIWANIYTSKRIARINAKTGVVNSYIDLSPLYTYVAEGDYPEVLNGIAYDQVNKRIFVTGKLWKYIFEIELKE